MRSANWQLDARISNSGRTIELQETIALAGQVVPEGFRSDGASIPRLLWPIARPFGSSLPAALLHDYLLQHSDMRRKDCDRLFLVGLRETTPYRIKPYLLYAAVRLYSVLVKRNRKN